MNLHPALNSTHGFCAAETIRVLARQGRSETDAEYYGRRAAEEGAAADRSADALVSTLHRELAQRYAGLSAAIRAADEQTD